MVKILSSSFNELSFVNQGAATQYGCHRSYLWGRHNNAILEPYLYMGKFETTPKIWRLVCVPLHSHTFVLVWVQSHSTTLWQRPGYYILPFLICQIEDSSTCYTSVVLLDVCLTVSCVCVNVSITKAVSLVRTDLSTLPLLAGCCYSPNQPATLHQGKKCLEVNHQRLIYSTHLCIANWHSILEPSYIWPVAPSTKDLWPTWKHSWTTPANIHCNHGNWMAYSIEIENKSY